jgi:diguanylate cyclase (GGDEF)-like protein
MQMQNMSGLALGRALVIVSDPNVRRVAAAWLSGLGLEVVESEDRSGPLDGFAVLALDAGQDCELLEAASTAGITVVQLPASHLVAATLASLAAGVQLVIRAVAPVVLELESAALRDALTRLHNRDAAGILFRRIVSEKNWAVLMIDVDRFKRVNDRFGHLAGDAVLVEVASRLKARLRRGDVVRWGGEEFLVILAGAELAGAAQVAEQLRQAIAERPFDACGTGLPVTVSIGVAAAPGQESWRRVVEGADRALYAAKHAGRNRVAVHPTQLRHPFRRVWPWGGWRFTGLPGRERPGRRR